MDINVLLWQKTMGHIGVNIFKKGKNVRVPARDFTPLYFVSKSAQLYVCDGQEYAHANFTYLYTYYNKKPTISIYEKIK